MINGKKLGLVLSGGGYRAAAHIGVLKAMEELDVVPDMISGTSAGAVVGALYSAGYKWQDILTFLQSTPVINLRNYTFQKAGLLDSAKYVSMFEEYFPDNNFSSLKIPLFIATTDLMEAKTKFFYEGELIRPLIASSAIPGIFSPVNFQNTLLCDGGVTDNLPTEPLVSITDSIIGVYINPLQKIKFNNLKNTRSVIQRAYLIIRETQSKTNFKNCDLLIAPEELNNYNILSKNNLSVIFEMGYVEAKGKLPKFIQKLKDQ